MAFRFAYPAILLLVLAAAGWAVLALRRRSPGITHSEASLLARFGEKKWRLAANIPLALRVSCLVLLVLAAARPQLYNVSRDIQSPGVDIMLCIDTSGSMQALDFTLDKEPVSRLTAVKKVVDAFIRKRDMDRIGLVVFGQEAFTQSPLTLDKGLLLGLVSKMEIGMAAVV
jgi:Ca-activated chloride channel family protein